MSKRSISPTNSSRCSTEESPLPKLPNDNPTFNGKYEILGQIGQGHTSKVYQVRCIKQPEQMFALKLIKNKYLS